MNSRIMNKQMTPTTVSTEKKPTLSSGLPKVRQNNSSSMQLHNEGEVERHETPLSHISKKAIPSIIHTSGKLPTYHMTKQGQKAALNADLEDCNITQTEQIRSSFDHA